MIASMAAPMVGKCSGTRKTSTERNDKTAAIPAAVFNNLLRDHQLHAPVLLTSGRGLVGCDRRLFAFAVSGDVIAGDAGGDEVVTHRVRAFLRQGLIHRRAA